MKQSRFENKKVSALVMLCLVFVPPFFVLAHFINQQKEADERVKEAIQRGVNVALEIRSLQVIIPIKKNEDRVPISGASELFEASEDIREPLVQRAFLNIDRQVKLLLKAGWRVYLTSNKGEKKEHRTEQTYLVLENVSMSRSITVSNRGLVTR